MSTEIRNIVMDFNGFKALNGISLKIQDGEFIAVLGPSGCGKTTLLRLLAGFNHPSSGEIRIGEQVVANRDYVLPPNERFISMVFQSYALWPHMSVRKNVEFPIKNSKFVSPEIRSNCDSRVQELIGMVGLTGMESGCLPSCPVASGREWPGRAPGSEPGSAADGRAVIQSGYGTTRGDAPGDQGTPPEDQGDRGLCDTRPV